MEELKVGGCWNTRFGVHVRHLRFVSLPLHLLIVETVEVVSHEFPRDLCSKAFPCIVQLPAEILAFSTRATQP